MPEPLDSPRSSSEQKLTAILAQLARLRLRLNALALQRALFASLALIIGAGAIVVLAALLLGPLSFLAAATLLVFGLLIGLVRFVRDAWRARVDAASTASLADRRADFKDRLTTLVSLSQSGETALWPYLLEETLTQQQEFAVSRLQRRRVSHSIYALLASGILASLAATLLLAPARLGLTSKASIHHQANASADNLQVRPSDPGADQDAQANADADGNQQTSESDQAGAESGSNGTPGNDKAASSKLMDKARDFASALQNKLTGRKAPERAKIDMRNTDQAKNRPKSQSGQSGGQDGGSQSEPDRLAENGGERGPQQPQSQNPRGGASVPGGDSGQDQPQQSKPNDRMANKPIVGQTDPNQQMGNNFSNGSSGSGAGRNGPGAASHGSGTDPEHLFGKADKPPTAKDGFSITLEARLSESGPAAGGHGYVPPKVRSSLNSTQQPDEPLSRAAVPDDDRDAIKRVFER